MEWSGHFQLQAAPFLHIPVSVLLFFHSNSFPQPLRARLAPTLFHTRTAFHCISHLFSVHRSSLFIISVPQRQSQPSVLYHFYSSFCALSLSLSLYPTTLSIPCGWPPSREAHFLILELPERQRVTGLGRPTKTQQTQSPSCLQEVDSRPFVFSFYKRKFCRGLPGRSDEVDTHTHTQTTLTPFIHSHRQTQKHTHSYCICAH